VRGEAVITRMGLQGGSLYALSDVLREAIASDGHAVLLVDLVPDRNVTSLEQKLRAPRNKQSLANVLRKALSLSPVAIGLLHEAAVTSSAKLSELPPEALAALIKAVPVRLVGVEPIARSISTAGGIAFDEIDEHFMLRRRPGTFVAGEMLDWEAPTGGYLLQACFATGAAAGRGALLWLNRAPTDAALVAAR
jgi:predicted flavoprotein YhiN